MHWLLHCINLNVCPEIFAYSHFCVFLPVEKKSLEIVRRFNATLEFNYMSLNISFFLIYYDLSCRSI